jgi:hypothetical protein
VLVKKAVYYVLAAGPFLLLGVIAINSRLSSNHWDFVEYGPETSKRIEAYATPVALARAAVVNSSITSGETLRESLDAWLEGGREGMLKDIPPPTTMNDGSTLVYEQILDAKLRLTTAALRRADELALEGQTARAADLYVDVVELGQIAKYSEFASLAEGSTYQVSALIALARIAPRLEEPHRQAIHARLATLDDVPEQSLTNMVDRFSVAYSRDVQRTGKSMAMIEIAHEQQRLASAEDPIQARIEGWQRLSVHDTSLVTLYGRSRSAYIHHLRFVSQIADTMRALLPVS